MKKHIQALLKELEKTQKTFWNISPEVGAFLNQLIITNNYKSVLEIGTSNAYSAIWLAEALTKTKGKLHTIESNYKKRVPLAQENIKKSHLKNIELIVGHAPEAIPSTTRKFDLAFFDATKYEHLSYFRKIAPRIKTGGLIITDNISSHAAEFKPYIKHLQSQKNWKSTKLNIGTGLLISEKLTAN